MAEEEIALDGGTPQESLAGPAQEVEQVQASVEPEAAPEVTLQDLAKQLQGFQREFGRVRGLQSQLDTLPKTVEKTIAERMAAMQKDTYLNSLDPESRLSYQQQQEGQKQLEEFLFKALEAKMPGLTSRYGDFTKFFERMSSQFESQDYFDQVAEALGPDAEKGILEVKGLLGEIKSKLNSNDPVEAEQAHKLRALYISNPYATALAVKQRMQQQIIGQANGVVSQQRANASRSAIVPKGSGSVVKAPTRLTKEQMNDAKFLESIQNQFDTKGWEKLLQDSRA